MIIRSEEEVHRFLLELGSQNSDDQVEARALNGVQETGNDKKVGQENTELHIEDNH